MNFRAIFVALAGISVAQAGPTVVIYQPAPVPTVVSPLTPPVAQANQSLLNQINNTIGQRRTEHQIVTTNALLRTPTPVVVPLRVEK